MPIQLIPLSESSSNVPGTVHSTSCPLRILSKHTRHGPFNFLSSPNPLQTYPARSIQLLALFESSPNVAGTVHSTSCPLRVLSKRTRYGTFNFLSSPGPLQTYPVRYIQLLVLSEPSPNVPGTVHSTSCPIRVLSKHTRHGTFNFLSSPNPLQTYTARCIRLPVLSESSPNVPGTVHSTSCPLRVLSKRTRHTESSPNVPGTVHSTSCPLRVLSKRSRHGTFNFLSSPNPLQTYPARYTQLLVLSGSSPNMKLM